jgi:hypothetical protein
MPRSYVMRIYNATANKVVPLFWYCMPDIASRMSAYNGDLWIRLDTEKQRGVVRCMLAGFYTYEFY